MSRLLGATAAAFLALAAGISAASAQNISGRYTVEGTNMDGSRYTGRAVITATSQNTCRIDWDTGSTATGICMRNRNAFAAGYTMGNVVGLVIYEIMPDGTLSGLWTVADQPGVGTEVLRPAK